ncbi:unnamed protein product [Trypanosoma congolense IL3000]|uniref:WGS project CAEQ00000000 data, annotated contig 422 n=1 Tax=Trypanosoma congolense (strain IL3000) TaxID=1068625 RepID=F9WFS1_TRYCI|nr:unnamed protein product [Trypanosoma congolense IL3000]
MHTPIAKLKGRASLTHRVHISLKKYVGRSVVGRQPLVQIPGPMPLCGRPRYTGTSMTVSQYSWDRSRHYRGDGMGGVSHATTTTGVPGSAVPDWIHRAHSHAASTGAGDLLIENLFPKIMFVSDNIFFCVIIKGGNKLFSYPVVFLRKGL